jgi:hypothetical protein
MPSRRLDFMADLQRFGFTVDFQDAVAQAVVF